MILKKEALCEAATSQKAGQRLQHQAQSTVFILYHICGRYDKKEVVIWQLRRDIFG